MEFLKPDNLNNVWASGGDRLYPGDTKYASGWGVEIPPRQYFNEIDYKQDQMLAHINQHGIPVWDAETEYQLGKSYVQGSDGVVYKATQTNTNINPVGDLSTWTKAFVDSGDVSVSLDNVVFFGNLVMQWVSVVGVVPNGIGSVAILTATLPVPLSSILHTQLTQGFANTSEAAEMAYSVVDETLTSVSAKFYRLSGNNVTGTEETRANFFVIGTL